MPSARSAVPSAGLAAALAAGLAIVAIAAAAMLGNRARLWNDELAVITPPVVRFPVAAADPQTPRLTRRVIVVVIDGLGADEANLPYLDELRRRGAAAIARVPYPTISRPSYVTVLSGSPPRDSGVRANRIIAPVAVDTIMDRARAAGLFVGAASDLGVMVSLFLRGTPSILGIDWVAHGTHVAPPPPITWPIDDARRTDALAALGPEIAALAAGPAAVIPVLVLDVDRAGHASGVGADYRAAAAAADRMLLVAFAGLDFARDTVIVTADHGHVAPGGHGGPEREVSWVPLVLAGSGIVPGAIARDPRLIDVAPTVAALLGIPAVPSLARTQQIGAAGVVIAIVAQALAGWRAIRHAADRRAAANGIALIGLTLALTCVALARAWFSPPFLEVPPPLWMVAVPTLDLAAATCAAGNLVILGLALRRRRIAR